MTWISVYSVMSSLPIKQALLSTIHGTQKQWKMQGCQPQRTVNKLLSLLCVSFINSEWDKANSYYCSEMKTLPGRCSSPRCPPLSLVCQSLVISHAGLWQTSAGWILAKSGGVIVRREKNMESFTPISFYDLKIILVHFDIITLMLKNLLSSL